MKWTYRVKYLFVFSCVLLFLSLNRDLFEHLTNRLFNLQHHSFPEFNNKHVIETKCIKPKIILYGIFSTMQNKEKRMILRSKKQCDFENENHSTVFVLGRPENRDDYEQLLTESMLYKDILVLNCKENMNEGKTFYYFYESFTLFPCFLYYAKVDDDTAFRPNQLTNLVSQFSEIPKVHIGRTSVNHDTHWFYYAIKLLIYRRNMSWLYDLKSYHAGLLYILSKTSVSEWVNLRPVEFYGDEDMRTSYYMTKINSTMVNVETRFHDYIPSDTSSFIPWFLAFIRKTTSSNAQTDWKRPITDSSLAVHLCKTYELLSQGFDDLCQ